MSKSFFTFTINKSTVKTIEIWLKRNTLIIIVGWLVCVSVVSFAEYYKNGLGLAYNDARSHLDIGRRVVEGLKPGLAQLGSVWLPLTHILMIPTIWNDFMWHSGLSGALQSMAAFVWTGIVIYLFLKEVGVGILGRIIGLLVFILNLNILYLQSTAMTELLLLATMTTGVYELLLWSKRGELLNLIKSSLWIMLSTLIRYDGWFLFGVVALLVGYTVYRKKSFSTSVGVISLFSTLAGFGIAMWFLWNQLIFKDALYFIYGPFSAHAQQKLMEEAGVLETKSNLLMSFKVYFYALFYNSGTFTALLGMVAGALFFFDKRIKEELRIASLALTAPFIFNVLALYLGHSVLFIQGISGNTWFNVRYGIMLLPTIAIFIGYLVERAKEVRVTIIGLLLLVTAFSFTSFDAVTIDDALVGSSQKNVTEVANWLKENAQDGGFILISVASHDAIVFSSGLPMKRFIHEGTGEYWASAVKAPDRWAQYIIMRTNDDSDLAFRELNKAPLEEKYTLVGSYPFADVYQIKPQYLSQLTDLPQLNQ